VSAGSVLLAANGLEPRLLVVGFALLLVVAGRELRLVRLRTSLNQALHEVRRPLQALALDRPGAQVRQAIRAVGQLDSTLNGGVSRMPRSELIACRLMVDSCVRRWRSRAHLAGAEIELEWLGPDSLVRGDGIALCGAIENLIVNAIEHGGPAIRVRAASLGRWVRIEIVDSGLDSRPAGRGKSPAEVIAGQRGGGSHGHGLEIARSAIEGHGGRLELNLDRTGSTAAVALPCSRRCLGSTNIRVNW